MINDQNITRGDLQHWMLGVWAIFLCLAFVLSGFHFADIFHQTGNVVPDTQIAFNEHLKKVAFNILNNILGMYLPIAAIMISSFFTANDDYRQQKISPGLAKAAVGGFAIIQLVNLIYLLFFIFFSGDLEVANMPVIQNAALTSILGVLVTFAFPEKKNSPNAETHQLPLPNEENTAG